MFRVEFFCDDRKVGDALRGLMGIAIGAPTATPVINAEKTSTGKIKAQSNGKLIELFAHYIANSKADAVTSKETSAWLEKMGMSRLSVSYVVKQGVMHGILKRAGMGTYKIIRALPKPTKGGTKHG